MTYPLNSKWEKKLSSKIHMLHIGKTGGSALKQALSNEQSSRLKLHGHGVSLEDIPKTEKVFFVVRGVESRFISGFYSRKRSGKGNPGTFLSILS